MRLHGPVELGGHLLRVDQRRSRVALLHQCLVRIERARTHPRAYTCVAHERGRGRPARLQHARRGHRIPLVIGHDSDEILDAHDARAGNRSDRCLVDVDKLSPHRRWTNHAAVQHAVDDEIVNEHVPPGDLARDVGPRQRLADDGVRGGIAQLRLRVHLDAEVLAGNQFGVANAGAAGFRTHLAVDRIEFRRGLARARRCERDQRLARRRRRLPNLHAAAHDAAAAGGRALVGRQRGVAFDQYDALDADAEFFGGHLRNRDAQSLAEIDLARIDRHRPVGVDRDEAVDVAGVERLADRCVGACNALRKAPRREA